MIVEAPDRDTLSFLRAMRRLYAKSGVQMTKAEKWSLLQRFAIDYPKVKSAILNHMPISKYLG